MSSMSVALTSQEQIFLMHMYETSDPVEGAEKFIAEMVKQGIPSSELKTYLIGVMAVYEDKFKKDKK